MKHNNLRWIVVLACGLLLAPAAFSQSQITTGTIQGTVTDQTGAVVPNAKVVIRNTATGLERTTATDDNGLFVAPLLDVGVYQIAASASGFGETVNTGYNLTLGQSLVANIQLRVAQVGETVTVVSEAPIVETSRTDASTLVNNRLVESLPLNGRRFLDLAFLTPGVSREPERGNISFAGARGINSNINIDGADFNQPFFGGQRGGERSDSAYVVSQEAVREFQVVRGGFAPEFGRSSGGVVNVITKSGANDFHGNAFYYLRHREFAPRDVFGDERARTIHQFGGALGGPIVRDRTFFYNVWDQQKETRPLTVRFNQTAGLPADLLAQQGVFQSTNDVWTYLVKIDHRLTGNTQLTGRYNWSRNEALNGTFTGLTSGVTTNNGTEKDRTHTVVVNANTVLRPTLLNEFRSQYSYEERPRVNNGEGSDYNPVAGPQVQVSGCCFFGGVSYLPIVQDDDRIQLADNVSYIRGGHNFKFGFDYNRSHVNQIFRGNWRGVYIFNSLQNYLNTLNKVPGAVADQFRVFFGNGAFSVAQTDVAGFAQDNWRIHPRVTLTGGVRYEASLNPQPANPNPQLPLTSKIANTYGWQPRFGLNFDVFGNQKTVLRLASGIYYARTPMLLLNQAFNSNGSPDVGVTFTLNAAQIRDVQRVRPEFVFPFVPNTDDARNSSFFTGANIQGVRPDASFFAPNYENPRSLNISAGVEQLISSNLAISLDWVHLNTVHLERIRDVNFFPPVTGLDNSAPAQMRPLYNTQVRPNPSYGILRQQESSARSNYDGLTLSLNKRYSSGFQFLTSYTLAWNRDDDSNERNFAGIAYEDAFDLAREFRWSRNDIRHRWVGSGSFDLPGGFQVAGIFELRSGLPFSAFTGVDSNRDGQFTDKPIVNGVPLLRNAFRQPKYFNTDVRVSKFFPITERHRVILAADLFNLFNRRNWAYNVSTNESSTTALGSRWGTGQTPLPTFQSIYLPDGTLNTGGARVGNPFQMQLSLKYNF
jgi:hypothetical protein